MTIPHVTEAMVARVKAEEDIIRLAMNAGAEEVTVLWAKDDLPHRFKTGDLARYLAHLEKDMDDLRRLDET